MKIGIFGGTFDPIHKGHVKVADFAIEELNLDKLFFVPAAKSPFKKKKRIEDNEHRVELINRVLSEKTDVSLFEINRGGTSYTIETVKYFKQKYPNDELYLLIGSDNLGKLNKWRDINDIKELVKIVVFKRDKSFSKINAKKYDCTILNNDIFEESSTEFKKGRFEFLTKEQMEYVGENFLYINDIMVSMMEVTRLKHSRETAKLAPVYAKLIGVDARKAYFAGLVHDITKNWPKEKHREFLERHGYLDKLDDFQLHSLSARVWLEKNYMVKDEEILNAVEHHTSLSLDPKPLDKVIYAADKLDSTRRLVGIQTIRNDIMKDFDTGFKNLLRYVYNQLIENRGELEDWAKEIYERLM